MPTVDWVCVPSSNDLSDSFSLATDCDCLDVHLRRSTGRRRRPFQGVESLRSVTQSSRRWSHLRRLIRLNDITVCLSLKRYHIGTEFGMCLSRSCSNQNSAPHHHRVEVPAHQSKTRNRASCMWKVCRRVSCSTSLQLVQRNTMPHTSNISRTMGKATATWVLIVAISFDSVESFSSSSLLDSAASFSVSDAPLRYHFRPRISRPLFYSVYDNLNCKYCFRAI